MPWLALCIGVASETGGGAPAATPLEMGVRELPRALAFLT